MLTRQLHQAATVGDTDRVRELLLRGANPHFSSDTRGSPLEAAICMGHVDVVRELLDNGASTEQRNNLGYTPLLVSTLLMSVASRNGRHTAEHEAVLSFLVIRGGCVDATDPFSASVLHILCAFGCAAGILYLLADTSDHRIFLRPRSLGEFQSILSPLHTVESAEEIGKAIASDPFLVMAVSLLRAHFALLLNRAGPGFLTPLHYAAASGDPVTVSLMLAAGCNPDIVDARGWTPLFWGALSRSTSVVKLLNVNPLPSDFRCRSPLDLVDSVGKPSLARLFTHSDDTTRATTERATSTRQASSSVAATASNGISDVLLPPRPSPSCAEDALLTVLCVLTVVSAFLSPNGWLVVATASTVAVTGCYLLWHQCQQQSPAECATSEKSAVSPAVPSTVYESSPASPQEISFPPPRRPRRSLPAGVVAPGIPVRLDKFGLVHVDFSPKPAPMSPFINMDEEFLVFSWVLTRIISTYIQSQQVLGKTSFGESPRRTTRSQTSVLSSGGIFQAVVSESDTEDCALTARFTEYRVYGCLPARHVRSRFSIDSIAETNPQSSVVLTDPELIPTVLRKGNSELSATDSADSIRCLHRRPPVQRASLNNNLWDAVPSEYGVVRGGSQGGLPQGLTLEIVDGSDENLAEQLLEPTSLSFACEARHGSPLPTSHSFPGNLEFLIETVAAARAGSLTARQRATKRAECVAFWRQHYTILSQDGFDHLNEEFLEPRPHLLAEFSPLCSPLFTPSDKRASLSGDLEMCSWLVSYLLTVPPMPSIWVRSALPCPLTDAPSMRLAPLETHIHMSECPPPVKRTVSRRLPWVLLLLYAALAVLQFVWMAMAWAVFYAVSVVAVVVGIIFAGRRAARIPSVHTVT